jgi:hypothetical protein
VFRFGTRADGSATRPPHRPFRAARRMIVHFDRLR